MTEPLLHDRETSGRTEGHLKANADKFNGHCKFVLGLLRQGKILTARRLEKDFDVDGRRLRNIYEAREEIKRMSGEEIHRDFVYTEDGKKTRFVKYWLVAPKPQSIGQVVAMFVQKELFT